MSVSHLKSLAVAFGASAFFIPSSQAVLVVYEGYQGYTAGAMGTGANTNPNANTIGLDTATAYGGSGVGNYTYTTSGISFGSLATSGGALTFSTGTAVIAGKMSLSSTYTGTLYSSFLIQLTTKGGASGDGFESRLGTATSTTGIRLRTFADSRSGTLTAVGNDYVGNAIATSSTTLGTGTYIMISSFTNVGGNLATTSGVATTYALTLNQFQNLIASSNWESYLNSTAVGTGDNEISVRYSNTLTTGTAAGLVSGDYAHFVSVGDQGKVDELRWGTTLADVLPLVPEPSTTALSVSTLGFLLFRRKRDA